MKKVELNMNENEKYMIIKKLIENGETPTGKKRAAVRIGCSLRHIYRLISRYKTQGKAGFVHKNKGKKPVHATSQKTKDLIVDLYRTKYDQANFTHLTELLNEYNKLNLSETTVRSILADYDILPPKAWKRTRKRHADRLRQQRKKMKTKKDKETIDTLIETVTDPHPRRPRSSYFGEMVQMDASVHLWFGQTKTQLHAAIDDSTGAIVGAYFAPQETLKGYYNVLHQILQNYGIPAMFYTDRRTVFEYKQKKASSLSEDTFTQFSYACKQLGIDIKTTSQAQSKGRVERLFQTLQSRLPVELNLKGATTLAEANEFLNSYLKKFNQQFALPINHSKSVFEKQPSDVIINQTLAVLSPRKIDTGHCIRFKNNYYRPLNTKGHHTNFLKGTDAIVIEAFDGQLFTSINDHVYAMDVVPLHERHSRNFDPAPIPKKKPRPYIPDMQHPWRVACFSKHLDTMSHQLSFPEICQSQALLNTESLL